MQRIGGDATLRATLRARSLASAAQRDWGRIWDDLFTEYARAVGMGAPVPLREVVVG
jgi:hypothetical protein